MFKDLRALQAILRKHLASYWNRKWLSHPVTSHADMATLEMELVELQEYEGLKQK